MDAQSNMAYYTPVYVHTTADGRSDVEKCMEKPEYADILQKQLKNEDLTDEDTVRITECVKRKQDDQGKAVGIVLVIMLVIIVVSIIISLTV